MSGDKFLAGNRADILRENLKGKSSEEKGKYLKEFLCVASFNIENHAFGYWLLTRNDGKTAIFSHEKNQLIEIPHEKGEDPNFGDISILLSLSPRGSNTRVMIAAIGGIRQEGDDPIRDISSLGVIHDTKFEKIEGIPSGVSIMTGLRIYISKLRALHAATGIQGEQKIH
ncbi:MAG: hypothetical protein HHAS10_05400 [Candidatus Altimarinota bacterium]